MIGNLFSIQLLISLPKKKTRLGVQLFKTRKYSFNIYILSLGSVTEVDIWSKISSIYKGMVIIVFNRAFSWHFK